MPRMWKVPDVAGHLHGRAFPRPLARRRSSRRSMLTRFSRLAAYQLLDQIGEPATASGRPASWPPRRPATSTAGDASRRLDAPRPAFRRQFLLLDAPGRRPIRQAWWHSELVVVERMRQRHQDRGPAHDGQLGHGRGAGAADHEVRLGHPLGQVREERGDLRRDAGRRVGLLRHAPGPPRGTAARRTGWRAVSPAAAPAPAAPRRRRSARPGCRRTPAARTARPGRGGAIALRRPVDHGVAHRVAGEARLGRASASPDTWSARTRWRCAVTRVASMRLARPSTAFCSCSAVGMRAQRGGHQRRKRRIAAEADHRAGLTCAQQLAGGARRRARAIHAGPGRRRRASAPASVADGTR